MKSRPTPLLNTAFIALAFVASSIVTGCEQSESQPKTSPHESGPESAPDSDPASQKPSDPSCGGAGGS